jgi:spermidine synthase
MTTSPAAASPAGRTLRVGSERGHADRDRVSARFEELDWRPTPMGAVSLRRRHDPFLDTEVYEVKLDDAFLMSSLFTVAETAAATFALARLPGSDLDVAVGGLGLGYTALSVLKDVRVRSLVVVEALDAVIGWHERGLVPAGAALTSDARCRFVLGDFMAMTGSAAGIDPQAPGRRFDAIIVDIDHSPRHLLHPSHALFYQPSGLRCLAGHLRPGGSFALWSNDPPEPAFLTTLGEVFVDVVAETVAFNNPLQDGEATNTVYVARTTT